MDKNNWISVNDRLPEIGKEVIVLKKPNEAYPERPRVHSVGAVYPI